MDEKKFKVFIFDTGIAPRILGLDLAEWVTHSLEVELFGLSSEQLEAQEFMSYSEPSLKDDLVQDRIEVLESFFARLYGRHSAKTKLRKL